MAFATNRAWFYLPSIVLQALAVGLAVRALTQGPEKMALYFAILVVAGVVALLTVIDVFFAALFSWGG